MREYFRLLRDLRRPDECHRAILQANRAYLELAILFRQQLDDPVPDLDVKLDGLICDVADLIARMEEWV